MFRPIYVSTYFAQMRSYGQPIYAYAHTNTSCPAICVWAIPYNFARMCMSVHARIGWGISYYEPIAIAIYS